jgi:hypothetical protein
VLREDGPQGGPDDGHGHRTRTISLPTCKARATAAPPPPLLIVNSSLHQPPPSRASHARTALLAPGPQPAAAYLTARSSPRGSRERGKDEEAVAAGEGRAEMTDAKGRQASGGSRDSRVRGLERRRWVTRV